MKRVSTFIFSLKTEPTNQYILLVIITLVAASLRYYRLGEWSFWIEEHHSLRHVALLNLNEITDVLGSNRAMFYVPLKIVFLFMGITEWSARLVSSTIGLATIPVLYLLTKKIFDIKVALMATLLLAIAPWHVYWSQNARFYTLFLLLYNISLFAIFLGLEKDRIGYLLMAVLTLGLAGSLQPFGVVLLPLVVVYFLVVKIAPFNEPVGLRLRNLVTITALPLLAYLCYEIYRVTQTRSEPFISSIYAASNSFVGYLSPFVMLTSTLYYIGTPLACLSLYGSYALVKKRSRAGLLLSLGAFLPLAIMMLLTPISSTSNRYVFMTLPCWIILAAVGVRELFVQASSRSRVLPVVLLGVTVLLVKDPVVKDIRFYLEMKNHAILFLIMGTVVVMSGLILLTHRVLSRKRWINTAMGVVLLFVLLTHPIVTDAMYFAYQHGHRDDWNFVSATILPNKIDGDLIVTSLTPLAAYYLKDKIMPLESTDLDAELRAGSRLWLIEDIAAGKQISQWADTNCVLTGSRDLFTAGRIWPMRVHLCATTSSSTRTWLDRSNLGERGATNFESSFRLPNKNQPVAP